MLEEFDIQRMAWCEYCAVETEIIDRIQQLQDHFGSFYVSSIPPPDVWNTLEIFPRRERPYTPESIHKLQNDTSVLRTWMKNELPIYENPRCALAWLYLEFCH